MEPSDSHPIDVVDKSKAEYAKVGECCPRCGNAEAFRSASFISGEQAGKIHRASHLHKMPLLLEQRLRHNDNYQFLPAGIGVYGLLRRFLG